MVAMDPNDPESVERASAVVRMHANEFDSTIRNSLYLSWLRSKDVDAVELKYRDFLDRALRDFHRDPDEYMLSIDMGRQSPGNQATDDGHTFNAEEQQIRIMVYIFWIGLLPQQRSHDALHTELHKKMDAALSGLRDDPDAFGSEFHWKSK